MKKFTLLLALVITATLQAATAPFTPHDDDRFLAIEAVNATQTTGIATGVSVNATQTTGIATGVSVNATQTIDIDALEAADVVLQSADTAMDLRVDSLEAYGQSYAGGLFTISSTQAASSTFTVGAGASGITAGAIEFYAEYVDGV